MQGKIRTPLGLVDRSLIEKFIKLAGFRWDKENQDWIILQDEVRGWKLDPYAKSEEKKYKRATMWLTVREYNMRWAMFRKGNHIEEAMKLVEEKLMNGDESLFLPDVLAYEENQNSEDRPYNYNKIFREMETKKLNE